LWKRGGKNGNREMEKSRRSLGRGNTRTVAKLTDLAANRYGKVSKKDPRIDEEKQKPKTVAIGSGEVITT